MACCFVFWKLARSLTFAGPTDLAGACKACPSHVAAKDGLLIAASKLMDAADNMGVKVADVGDVADVSDVGDFQDALKRLPPQEPEVYMRVSDLESAAGAAPPPPRGQQEAAQCDLDSCSASLRFESEFLLSDADDREGLHGSLDDVAAGSLSALDDRELIEVQQYQPPAESAEPRRPLTDARTLFSADRAACIVGASSGTVATVPGDVKAAAVNVVEALRQYLSTDGTMNPATMESPLAPPEEAYDSYRSGGDCDGGGGGSRAALGDDRMLWTEGPDTVPDSYHGGGGNSSVDPDSLATYYSVDRPRSDSDGLDLDPESGQETDRFPGAAEAVRSGQSDCDASILVVVIVGGVGGVGGVGMEDSGVASWVGNVWAEDDKDKDKIEGRGGL